MLDLTGEDDDDDYAVLPPPPPINIKIDATTKIVGHGNVLACSPAETATRVAGMLVAALRQAKVLGGGDEGMGRMRPVEISVSAGVNVVGCRNVVGAAGVKAKPKLVEEGKEGGIEGMEGGRKRKAEAVSDIVDGWRGEKVIADHVLQESVEMPQTKRSNVGGEAEQNEKITPEGTK